jgi:hypothetical protein
MANEATPIEVFYDALREKYRRDFAQFAAEQLHITTTRPGEMTTLKINPPQTLVNNAYELQLKEQGYVRLVLIKGRQFGFSTYSQARMFHRAIFTRAFSTLLIALDPENTRAIFDKSRFFFDNLDPNLKPMVRYLAKDELTFENPDNKTRGRYPGLGSKMHFQSSTKLQVGTGTTQHGIHISEAAKFSDEATKFIEASLLPTLHHTPGTILINESTAFMWGDWFRKWCDVARSGKSDYKLVFVPWYIHPEYRIPLAAGEKLRLDPKERWMAKIAAAGQPDDGIPPFEITPEQFKWRRIVIASPGGDEQIFDQEYPTTYEGAWINYDTQVFATDKMFELRQTVVKPLRMVRLIANGQVLDAPNDEIHFDRDYCAIWKEPEMGHKYDIGVDCAAGLEDGDWSVAEVFDRDTHEQMAEYHVHKEGFDFAKDLVVLGKYYRTAQIAVEINSIGYGVNAGLQREGYPNLYIWRHRERSFPTLSTYSGWKTTYDSKGYLITIYLDYFRNKKFIIHSEVLWQEMRNFIRIPGMGEGRDQYRAGKGHDDCVMASGISLVAGDDESIGTRRTLEIAPMDRKAILEAALRESLKQQMSDTMDSARPKSDSMSKLKAEMKGFK